MNEDRPGKPPELPLRAPQGIYSLGSQTSLSLESGQQVRRRQQRGRQKRNTQNMLQGTG
jgi:hypothetical protein